MKIIGREGIISFAHIYWPKKYRQLVRLSTLGIIVVQEEFFLLFFFFGGQRGGGSLVSTRQNEVVSSLSSGDAQQIIDLCTFADCEQYFIFIVFPCE